MIPEMTLRSCTADDAAMLSRLASDTFADTFRHTCTEADMTSFLATHYRREQFEMELSDPEQHLIVAEAEGQPSGYLQFAESPLPFQVEGVARPLELLRLYVRREWQGAGIAGILMDDYLDFAARNGFDYCWLGVWEHNYRAQRFYARYGFAFTGHTHPFPIGATPQTDQWWAKTL